MSKDAIKVTQRRKELLEEVERLCKDLDAVAVEVEVYDVLTNIRIFKKCKELKEEDKTKKQESLLVRKTEV